MIFLWHLCFLIPSLLFLQSVSLSHVMPFRTPTPKTAWTSIEEKLLYVTEEEEIHKSNKDTGYLLNSKNKQRTKIFVKYDYSRNMLLLQLRFGIDCVSLFTPTFAVPFFATDDLTHTRKRTTTIVRILFPPNRLLQCAKKERKEGLFSYSTRESTTS